MEQEATTDRRFLKDGPGFLFFILVDRKSTPPPWVPDKYLRFNLEDYGLEQAIGAIKLRVQDVGGSIQRDSIADRARRAAEHRAFMIETDRLKHGSQGVSEVRESTIQLLREVRAPR